MEFHPDGSETAHIKHYRVKQALRQGLGILKLNMTWALSPGVSLFGVGIYRDKRPGPLKYRGSYALDHVLRLNPRTVLDVGSGGGGHAQEFRKHGSKVTCVDFGTSMYAEIANHDGLEVILTDFNRYESPVKYDLVWASHILEHQRNVGQFLDKLLEACSESGYVCITVPDPHRNLWGGHLSMWTPGLLAYNVAMCGVDLSDGEFIRGSNEFSLLFKNKRVPLPDDLTYDYGDLHKLAKYLPDGLTDSSDPWAVNYRNVLSSKVAQGQ